MSLATFADADIQAGASRLNLVASVRNQVRNLLQIRTERHVGPTGPRPAIGARIWRDDVRMQVQAGMTQSLWNWLSERGWREITFRPERRCYKDVPLSYVTLLIDCAPGDRQRVLDAGVNRAAFRNHGRARKSTGGPAKVKT